MADQNKPDLKAELYEQNEALKETLSLSKLLSDNIVNLAGGYRKVGKEGNDVLQDMREMSKSISNTIALTDKLNAGKLKDKEISLQINKAQAKYQDFLSKRIDQQSQLGKQISDSAKNETILNEDILNLRNKYADKQSNIEASNARIDALSASINQKAERLNNVSGERAKLLNKEIQALKAQRFEEDRGINVLERSSAGIERIISQKKKELEYHENILYADKKLADMYEKELNELNTINDNLKKQNSLFYQSKEEVKGIANKLIESVKSALSLSSIFSFLKKVAFDVSSQATQLEKSLVISNDEAYDLREKYNELAITTNDVFVTTNNLIAANVALGKQLGFNAHFSNDMNVQFVKLTKEIGLSEEAAGGLAKLSKVTGISLKETKNVALETSQRLSAQYGIQLDQKEVLEEIGKTSGQTLAMLKANPKALAEAVAQAKLLGTNLNNVKKQGESLLDFESSISNELEAELLTGRQFNLERARAAALTGDITTEMRELNSQGLDFNKFSNMNVIAQKKVADMLGLSTDELSDQLLKQQYMGKSHEDIVALAGEEVAKRLEAMNAQDKLNAAVEKMQDVFAGLVGGPLGKLVDMMASLADNSWVLFGAVTALAGVSLIKLIGGIAAAAVSASELAVGSTVAMSALTFGAGAIAVGAAIAGLAALYESFKSDVKPESVGDVFSSNGNTVVSTAEGGLFQLSPNDDFAAAPGLGDMINKPTQNTLISQDNSNVVDAIAGLNNTMKNVHNSINQLYNKQSIINVDSQKFGTAQVMGNYNFA
jgi:hypothetical protein